MAVINVFESSAQLGAPVNSQAGYRPDNSGAMAVARQDAGIAKTVVEGGNKLYEQMAVADVMKANNDINMRMDEVRNKLLQNKEQNALNNMTVYEEERRKIIDDVVKNGPASLRSVMGSRALMATVEKDWTSRKDFMERYQYGEMEKYKDTQLGTQYKLTLKDIADSYMDPGQVEEKIRRGEAFAGYRFMDYGPERVKAEQDRWRNAAVATAVQASLTASNYDRAGQLLQGYGEYLDPAAKMQFDRVVMERKKSDDQIVSFEDLYKRHGDDVEGAWAELGSKTGMADTAAGIDFARSKEGEQWGDNSCAIYTSAYITAAGGDERLKSTLSDGTYRNAEELGLTFSDRSQLRHGDLVYYSGTSQRYAASDDPNAVESSDKAYMGITHVGVYDAKTGKVIQSGSHGVSAIDIDTYNVVGFSHIGGRALSPTEQKQQLDDYRTYAANRKRDKLMAENARFDNWSKNLFAWKDQGVPWEQALKDAEQWAGNDLDLLKDVKNAVNLIYGEAKASGSGKKAEIDESLLGEMLRMGMFKDKFAITKFVGERGGNDTQKMSAMKLYDKWFKGTGEFKYEWSEIKPVVMGKSSNLSDAQQAQWRGLEDYGREWIALFTQKNGREPSQNELVSALKKASTQNYYGSYYKPREFLFKSSLEVSDWELRNAGIRSVVKNDTDNPDSDLYTVIFKDGRVEIMNAMRINGLLGREE